MAPTKAFRDALRKQDVDVPLAEVFTSLSQVGPRLSTSSPIVTLVTI